jgi:hypothetical protein
MELIFVWFGGVEDFDIRVLHAYSKPVTCKEGEWSAKLQRSYKNLLPVGQ